MQGAIPLLALLVASVLEVEGKLLRKSAEKPEELSDRGLESFGVSFEIQNYDYFGLTDEWSDPWADAQGVQEPSTSSESTPKKASGSNADPIGQAMDKVGGLVDGALKPLGKGGVFLQFSTRGCWRASDALVKHVVDSETSPITFMDALRTAIKSSIIGAIECERSETEKQSTAKEEEKGDKGKKEVPQIPNIHVTFRPGAETPTLSLLAESQGTPMLNKPRPSLLSTRTAVRRSHWSVIADVTITDRPKNDADDLKDLKKALNSGQLRDSLKGAMYEVTGEEADIRHLEMESAIINQWDVDQCKDHISGIVNKFALHYTRAQVPMALYNECTNFMPKMSFSRDHILDSFDARRCRRATVAFEKHWKYGKNAEPKDFELMCIEACEAKYGADAPSCHVTEGDKLKEQPKL